MTYGFAILVVAAATGICAAMSHFFAPANLVMVYLLGVLWISTRGRHGPAVASSILSVLAFDFFFVPPRFTLSVSDAQYLWTFVAMLVTALVISHLTVRLQEEADAARQGEQRSVWLMEKAKKAEVAAETEQLRSSLLSAVSHDLRTPLAAILGSAGALLGKEELRQNPPVKELLENIQTESERLSRLVQNLLQATRLESGVALHKERYPLEEVIGGALERVQPYLRERTVAVNLPDTLPLVPMDPVLLEQVFINLLENAIRHTPEGRSVEISARAEGGAVAIAVTDDGPGLNADELAHVFDKFYRRAASAGSGLGLAICRAIVDAHAGAITAENAPKGGAIFRFTLPLEDIHGQ